MRQFLLTVTAAAALGLAGACGGGSSGGAAAGAGAGGSTAATLSGRVFANFVQQGLVSAYKLDASGRVSAELIVTQTTTDTSGAFSLVLAEAPAAVLLEVTSGTYLDEATARTTALASDAPLRLVYAPVSGTVANLAVTPLSTIAAETALAALRQDATLPEATAVANANAQVARSFGFSSPEEMLRVAPVDVTSVTSTGVAAGAPGLALGMVTAGLSEVAQNHGVDVARLAAALGEDFSADGSFDGRGQGGANVALGTGFLSAQAAGTDLDAGLATFLGSARNQTGLTATNLSSFTAAVAAAPLTAAGEPTVSTVTPSRGVPAGGTTLTIVGSGFGTSPTVTIGGRSATTSSAGDTTIIAVTPAGASGFADVAVTNAATGLAGGLQGAFQYTTADASNQAPTLSVTTPTAATGETVTVRYTLADAEGDPAALTVEYQTGGAGAFQPAAPGAGGDGRWSLSAPSSGAPHTFVWHAAADVSGSAGATAVVLRLTPRDQSTGTAAVTASFTVNTNAGPSVYVLTPAGGRQTGTAQPSVVVVDYRLFDAEGDSAAVTVEYSVNAGQSWRTATPAAGAQTTALAAWATGSAHAFAWDAGADLPNQVAAQTMVRITPAQESTSRLGTPGTSNVFLVDTTAAGTGNTPPLLLQVTPPAGTQSGTAVLISSVIADADGDAAHLSVEFSTTNGITWAAAKPGPGGDGLVNLTTSTTGLAKTFSWNSTNDVPGLAQVLLRFTPFDAQTGRAVVIGPFPVDNRSSGRKPFATVASPTSPQSSPVYISYTLYDAGSQMLRVTVEYATNAGGPWRTCTEDTAATNPSSEGTGDGVSSLTSSPQGVGHLFVWKSSVDLPNQVTGTVWVKVTPIGAAGAGTPGTSSSSFQVDTTPTAPPPPPPPGGGGSGSGNYRAGTDKWHVDIDVDQDGNGQKDFTEAVNNATWSGAAPSVTTVANDLMGWLHQYYGNNADGTAATGGIPISFDVSAPPGGSAPSAGASRAARSGDYNVMAMRNIAPAEPVNSGTVGLATLDTSGTNRNVENDSGTGQFSGGNLGVRVDAFNYFWNNGYQSPRDSKEYTEHLGSTVAHEIGHSLGRQHNTGATPSGKSSIMAPSSNVSPGTTYEFSTSDYTAMQGYMPGQNRCLARRATTLAAQAEFASDVLVGTFGEVAGGVLPLFVRRTLKGGAAPGAMVELPGFEPWVTRADLPAGAAGAPVLVFLARDGGRFVLHAGARSLLPAGDEPQATERATAALLDALALRDQNPAGFADAFRAALVPQLDDADPRVRDDALLVLAYRRDLVATLDDRAVESIARVAVDAGSGSGTDAAEQRDRRLVALQVLGHAARPEPRPAVMAAALQTDDPGLLKTVAGVLRDTDAAAGAELRTLLAQSDDLALRRRAIVLLGWLGDREAVLPIARAALAGDADARRAAADALGLIGGEQAYSLLAAWATDAGLDRRTRRHAARALGELGTAEARTFLSVQAEDADRAGRADDAAAWRRARDFGRFWHLPAGE